MGLLNLLFDLPGKIKSVLSAQIRRNNKPTVTTYDVPVQREPMRHKKVHLGPTVQPVKPPIEIGVEPNIGQTISPNTATTVAPVEPKDLTDKDARIAELEQKLAEAQARAKVYERAVTEGKIGAAKASTDPVKLKNQADRAVKEELKKANEIAEANGMPTVTIAVKDEYEEKDLEEPGEDLSNEDIQTLNSLPYYTS